MPSRVDTHITGDIGECFVTYQLVKSKKWFVSDRQRSDYGIDLIAQRSIERPELDKQIRIQAKATESLKVIDKNIHFSLDRNYINYYLSCIEPVIFVVIHVREHRHDEAYYIHIQDWVHNNLDYWNKNQESYTIKIPLANSLFEGLKGPLLYFSAHQYRLYDVYGRESTRASRKSARESSEQSLVTSPTAFHIAKTDLLDVLERNGDASDTTKLWNEVYHTSLYSLDKLTQKDILSIVVPVGKTVNPNGLFTLSQLYQIHYESICKLNLPEFFLNDFPHVAYYCQWLEESGSNRPNSTILYAINNDFPEYYGYKIVKKTPTVLENGQDFYFDPFLIFQEIQKV
ncbi:hypothetical protein JOC95_001885 [Bacillus tianshenii]|uniref:DUF4365 domain-containing protein n=1 Tax=Sutcliffiella tianshenii TaxID=1463404 RepID=A0ABS2NZX7_9BACI|nr:DUF4365 domain-containing protein [Bacillus tianshenii]MBM7620033.1 hypothetical protein [Bacillus tianshenii]